MEESVLLFKSKSSRVVIWEATSSTSGKASVGIEVGVDEGLCWEGCVGGCVDEDEE